MHNEKSMHWTKIDNIKATTKKVMSDIGDGLEKITLDIKESFKGRNHTLMVRVTHEILDRVDQLVDTGFFASRSEAAAFLLVEGVKRQESLFSKLKESSEKIKNIRATMHEIIADELKDKIDAGEKERINEEKK